MLDTEAYSVAKSARKERGFGIAEKIPTSPANAFSTVGGIEIVQSTESMHYLTNVSIIFHDSP